MGICPNNYGSDHATGIALVFRHSIDGDCHESGTALISERIGKRIAAINWLR